MGDDWSEERDLWRRVILQSISDATGRVTSTLHNLDHIAARDWFRRDSADFREVCQMAGLDANHVRSTALDLMKRTDESGSRPIKLKSNERRVTSDGRGGKKAKLLTLNGVSKTVAEWASEAGATYATFAHRLWRGIPLEEAIAMGSRSRNGAYRKTGGGSELSPVG